MIGTSPKMQQIYRLARLVAPRDTAVLIVGATGTGKELVARGIHRAQPAQPRAVCRGELRRDTGESAGGGTIWLYARRLYRSVPIAPGPHSCGARRDAAA